MIFGFGLWPCIYPGRSVDWFGVPSWSGFWFWFQMPSWSGFWFWFNIGFRFWFRMPSWSGFWFNIRFRFWFRKPSWSGFRAFLFHSKLPGIFCCATTTLTYSSFRFTLHQALITLPNVVRFIDVSRSTERSSSGNVYFFSFTGADGYPVMYGV